MSKKRRQDGDELIETTNGSVRIAYDADTELYTWRRPDGVLMEGKYGPVNVVRQPSPPVPHPPGTFWWCSCCGKDKNAQPKVCDCGADCPVTAYDIPCMKCAKHCDAAWHKKKPGEPLDLCSPVEDGMSPGSASTDDKKEPKKGLVRTLTGLFKHKK